MKLFILLTVIYFMPLFFKENIWLVNTFSQIVIIFGLLALIFKMSKKVNERSILGFSLVYLFYEIIIYWPICLNLLVVKSYSYKYSIISFVSIITFIVAIYYISRRNYHYKGDKVLNENIFLCLKKPTTDRDVLTSLIGAPFASVTIYAENHMYGFKWSEKKYLKRYIQPRSLEKKYILFDTGIKCESKHLNHLEQLIGQKAKSNLLGLRIKCIYVIKSFLAELGPEYRPQFFEFIPSLYISKIMGVKK